MIHLEKIGLRIIKSLLLTFCDSGVFLLVMFIQFEVMQSHSFQIFQAIFSFYSLLLDFLSQDIQTGVQGLAFDSS